MNANSIAEKKFEKSFNGYKVDDVDEFLKTLHTEFQQLQNENSDLQKKLEVLADKIREYRSDEDALKDTLLIAQKQANILTANAKEKSENMITTAKTKSEEMIKYADDEVAKRKQIAKELTETSLREKERIINEAKDEAEDIRTKLALQKEKESDIIRDTCIEVEQFTQRLLTTYNHHIEEIKNIPIQSENDFIRKINEDTAKKREERDERNKRQDEAFNAAINASAGTNISESQEEDSEEDDGSDKESSSKGKATAGNNADGKKDDDDKQAPLYKKDKNKSKYEKVEFGNKGK